MRFVHKFNPLSCERFSELASKRLDSKLSFFERVFYIGHYLICFVCRRFNRQIDLIDKAAAQKQLIDEHGRMENSQQQFKLGEAARDRMAALLKNNTSTHS